MSRSTRARCARPASGGAARARASSVLLGHVFRRELAAITEQEGFALLLEDVVRLLLGQVEPILVHDLLRVLDPLPPGLGRDGVVDTLPERIVEGFVRESGQGLTELGALHHPGHRGGIGASFATGGKRGQPRDASAGLFDETQALGQTFDTYETAHDPPLRHRAIKELGNPWKTRSGT